MTESARNWHGSNEAADARARAGEPTPSIPLGFTFVLTNAPDAYDYGYVEVLGTVPVLGRDFRLVAIPDESLIYQCGRYESGSYVATVVQQP